MRCLYLYVFLRFSSSQVVQAKSRLGACLLSILVHPSPQSISTRGIRVGVGGGVGVRVGTGVRVGVGESGARVGAGEGNLFCVRSP